MGYVFKLEIHANHEPFGSTDKQRLHEIARCLRVSADYCDAGKGIESIRDADGRTIGTYVLTNTGLT